MADLVGLSIVLSRIPGKGHNKLITAGLGWATAEVILSRGLMLWIGARGAEFSWVYIQKCLESNISLVNIIIFIEISVVILAFIIETKYFRFSICLQQHYFGYSRDTISTRNINHLLPYC